MATKFYPAIIEPAGDGGFGVYFPDLPGCTSGGDSFDEAAAHAVQALALHLAGMVEDGQDIPEPSPPNSVDVPARCAMVFTPAELPGRHVRINITMDEGTLALADRVASTRGTTRSGLIAELVRLAAAPPMPAKTLEIAGRKVTFRTKGGGDANTGKMAETAYKPMSGLTSRRVVRRVTKAKG